METKDKRGLASADQETRAKVARLGGKAAHARGRAHQLTAEDRRRGGQNTQTNFKNRPKDEVIDAARKGGLASQAAKKSLTPTE